MYALPSRRHSRAHRRYPVELPVRFADDAELAEVRGITMHQAITRDVSRKGLCLRSDLVLGVGTELTLELGMNGTELVVHGKVVWCTLQETNGPALGIELTESEIDPVLFDWLLETGTGF